MPNFYRSFNTTRMNTNSPPSTAGGFSVGFKQDDFSPIINGLAQAPTKVDHMVKNIAEVAGREVVKLAKGYIGTGGPIVNVPGYSINGWPGLSPITMATRQKNNNYGQILLDIGDMRDGIKAHIVGGVVTVSASNWKSNYHEQDGKEGSSYFTAGLYPGKMPARPFLTPATFAVLEDPSFQKAIIQFIDANFDFTEFAGRERFTTFFYRAQKKTAAPKRNRSKNYKDKKRKK